MNLENLKKDFREFENLREGNYVRYENRFWKVENSNAERTIFNLKSIVEPYLSVEIGINEVIGIKWTNVYLDVFGFVKNKKNGFEIFEIESLILAQYPYQRKEGTGVINGGIGIYCLYCELIPKKYTLTDVVENSKSISTIHALQNYLKDYFQKKPYKVGEEIDFDKVVPRLKIY
jgi:hypothetical protein